jgi:cyclopropane fatty-acyl-phospholipid synthase-like methyltransferase
MDAFRRFEQAGWREKAAGYDRLLARITDKVVDHLLDAAGVTAGTRLLDVACGYGYATARAAERGAVATGVDQSAAMLGQPPEVRARIRAAFDRRVARYARGDGLSVPVSAKLAAGHLPGP